MLQCNPVLSSPVSNEVRVNVYLLPTLVVCLQLQAKLSSKTASEYMYCNKIIYFNQVVVNHASHSPSQKTSEPHGLRSVSYCWVVMVTVTGCLDGRQKDIFLLERSIHDPRVHGENLLDKLPRNLLAELFQWKSRVHLRRVVTLQGLGWLVVVVDKRGTTYKRKGNACARCYMAFPPDDESRSTNINCTSLLKNKWAICLCVCGGGELVRSCVSV